MAYDEILADRIRRALAHLPDVEEKKMFRGLTFMVDDKMCVSASGNEMMCRFDPALQEVVEKKIGFRNMIMKGKVLKGYCYVGHDGFTSTKDFKYWLRLCLNFNNKAASSKKKKIKKGLLVIY